MSKIAVLVDSSSYISPEDLEALNIKQINNPIMMGTQVFHENEDWQTPAEFYEMARTAVTPFTTSQPEIGVFMTAFNELAAAGYTEVIAVVLSSGISGTYSSVQSLAQTMDNIKIHAWDSQIAAAGAGNQAKLAAEMVQAGHDVPEILAALTTLRGKTNVYFAVDDIRHLQRTGRISGGQATLGSLLNIKPMLTFEDGKIIAIGKERAMKRAWKKMIADFTAIHDAATYPLRVAIVDGNHPDLADSWAAELQAAFPDVVVERSIIGPYIGVHTGEKAMGMIWGQDYKSLL
ncbi:DegV family protein [Weissella cibaria]|uniref:DegV family protein n=1 Tax=Weissella cibaria TaxID=137591 RepID=UPI001CD65A86|nr:DegV family protein [Weissella cibaria]MCA1355051.1 DegV family protein [Weissella cibaria]MDQ2126129.1 DegV family protein [Weissella cibaria]MDQ2158940.1 DegV family protein [Weissella cibaria]